MFLTNDELFNLMLLKASSGGGITENTVTGNPLVFNTGLARPLKSLLIPFTPKQTGSGDPSPENVRPITGWTGVKVNHAGRNILNTANKKSGTQDVIPSDNGIVTSSLVGTGNSSFIIFDCLIPKGTYTFSANPTGEGQNGINILCTVNPSNWSYVSYYGGYVQSMGDSITFTINEPAYIGLAIKTKANVSGGARIEDIQLEVGSSATAYEPYTAPDIYPVTWSTSGTVYGGYVDLVTGEVWATYIKISPTKEGFITSGADGIGWRQTDNIYPLCSSVTDWNKARQAQYLNKGRIANPYSETTYGDYVGVVYQTVAMPRAGAIISEALYQSLSANETVDIVYELASPVLITTLTPQQITALVGNNTLWSDAAGSMTAVYLKKA